MDFIKRLLLIFTLTTILTLNSGYCAEVEYKKSPVTGTISAPKNLESDYLNSKDNEINLNSINNQSEISLRRNQDNQNGSSNNHALISKQQAENLISYIHNQTYLENNSELALILLLHQIQPNAP